MANFEAFRRVIFSSINLSFLKSAMLEREIDRLELFEIWKQKQIFVNKLLTFLLLYTYSSLWFITPLDMILYMNLMLLQNNKNVSNRFSICFFCAIQSTVEKALFGLREGLNQWKVLSKNLSLSTKWQNFSANCEP